MPVAYLTRVFKHERRMASLAHLTAAERRILEWAAKDKAVIVDPHVARALETPLDLQSSLDTRGAHRAGRSNEFLPLLRHEVDVDRLRHMIHFVPEAKEASARLQLRQERVVLHEPWRPYVEALRRRPSFKRRALSFLYRLIPEGWV